MNPGFVHNTFVCVLFVTTLFKNEAYWYKFCGYKDVADIVLYVPNYYIIKLKKGRQQFSLSQYLMTSLTFLSFYS